MADVRYNGRQVTIQCDHAAPIVYNHFPSKTLWLGVVQVVGGVIMLIAGLVGMFSGSLAGVAYGSQGLEIVIPAILTGSFGIAAGRSKAICQITTSMIFSILTAMGSCGVVIMMAMALTVVGLIEAHPSPFFQQSRSSSDGRWGLVIMLVVALTEAVVSIVQAVIACHFSCFCCKRCCCNYDTTTTEQIVVSNAQQEQQLLLMGQGAPGAEMRPTAPVNYGYGQQMPPQYTKYDV